MSVPEWALLIVASAPVESIIEVPEEIPRLISRKLSEVALPDTGEAEVRRVAEFGPLWAAEEGLIEEEDLSLFAQEEAGDADALDRRSVSAGARDWTRPGKVHAFRIAKVLDSDGAESLRLDPGALALAVSVGGEDLGRLATTGHRERILARASGGDFGTPVDLPAAPVGTEEARDLLAATAAVANYAAGRATLVLYALRRALREDAGVLHLRAAPLIGGLEERDGQVVHRNGLAAVGAGEALVVGQTVASGTDGMLGSAPPFAPFGALEGDDGAWAWEEAGILTRWAILERLSDLA
jgi:RNA-splicing ligase RtcB